MTPKLSLQVLSGVPKRGRSKRGRSQKHTNERKRAQLYAKESKRAQKLQTARVRNHQVWELPVLFEAHSKIWGAKSLTRKCGGMCFQGRIWCKRHMERWSKPLVLSGQNPLFYRIFRGPRCKLRGRIIRRECSPLKFRWYGLTGWGYGLSWVPDNPYPLD